MSGFLARLRASLRVRLAVAVVTVVLASFAGLAWWLSGQLAPAYAEASEEALVDSAQVLASWCAAATPVEARDPDPRPLAAAWAAAGTDPLQARIHRLHKAALRLEVSLTDRRGIVLLDTARPQDVGRDNSRWNDVARTLQGRYGARTTRAVADDPRTAVMHIAAPVRRGGELIGVLTVSKPVDAMAPFVQAATGLVVVACCLAAAAAGLLTVAISAWITAPLAALTAWVARARRGEHPPVPDLGHGGLGRLAEDVGALAAEAEGRRYVETYVQDLTHELKSPLAGIRASAEILADDPPPEERRRFLGHLGRESERLGQLAERLLDLAAIERQVRPETPEMIDLGALASAVAEDLRPQAQRRGVTITVQVATAVLRRGQVFLIRQALTNLLQNAVAFARQQVVVTVEATGVAVTDDGPGAPAEALPRLGQRFVSLAKPDGAKGTGLGLAFTRRVAELHDGHLDLSNGPAGGFTACLTLG